MKKVIILIIIIPAITGYVVFNLSRCAGRVNTEQPVDTIVKLPAVSHEGVMSVEKSIFTRKAIRSYRNEALSLSELSQLLWAAGGKTIDGVSGATRSHPSAGGLYPIEIYLVVEKVEGIGEGLYHYNWKNHSVRKIKEGNIHAKLKAATFSSSYKNSSAAISIVLAANYSRTKSKYGQRAQRYVPMDIGAAAQTLHLQAEAIGLATVVIGAFDDSEIKELLGASETPLCIMPVGKK